MSLSTRALRSALRSHNFQLRTFSTTPFRASTPPANNMPPSAQKADRTQPIDEDSQSNASLKDGDQEKSGDDHPAKQPDPQQASDRSTGFGNVKEVKGGKEGLDQRTDR